MDLFIKVQYRHIPADIVGDLENLSTKEVEVAFEHDNVEHFEATGGPADILIYINNHLTEIIAGGVIGNAVSDALKVVLKAVWKKLVKYYASRRNQYYDGATSITLSFEFKDNNMVEYHLEGKVKTEAIDALTEEIFRHLQNTSLIECDFRNQDLIDDTGEKPKIRMTFDKRAGKWIPVNLAEFKKELDDYIKRTEKFDG